MEYDSEEVVDQHDDAIEVADLGEDAVDAAVALKIKRSD